MRPLNVFSTFSIWDNESEMLNMVRGHDAIKDGKSYHLAMKERSRKDFHHQFITMRFKPFKEIGTWNGKAIGLLSHRKHLQIHIIYKKQKISPVCNAFVCL